MQHFFIIPDQVRTERNGARKAWRRGKMDDESTAAGSNPQSTIEIVVKFGGSSIPISLSPDTTIKVLKTTLQPLTDVLPRGQKLIYKGKLLVDLMTLKESEVGNGAKIMLIASKGLHQGGGPILKDAQTQLISRNASKPVDKLEISDDKNRFERWKVTGVIVLAECNLKAIPDEVWACGSSARVLDMSNNSIQHVPAEISNLSSMQKLLLNANGLLDKSIDWEGLASLRFLTVLAICQNCLTTLPRELGALTSLRQLHISNNNLTSLPIEIGLLSQLEVLKANNNRLTSIPVSIGNCTSLIEVDVSSNLLLFLPEAFGNLRNLKALYLSNNGLVSLPKTLFKTCLELSTLDLHSTEITTDILRQFEGWEEFDNRRRSKHQKQLDFRVVASGEFDEGADKN